MKRIVLLLIMLLHAAVVPGQAAEARRPNVIYIVADELGYDAAGRKQPQHEYLYWEINGWTAIRQGNWRAVKPPRAVSWELYDLARDPSESKDLAADHREILAKLLLRVLRYSAVQANLFLQDPTRSGLATAQKRECTPMHAGFKTIHHAYFGVVLIATRSPTTVTSAKCRTGNRMPRPSA